MGKNSLTKRVLRDACAGQDLSEELGVSKTLFYQHMNPNVDKPNPLDRVKDLITHTDNDIIINHLCEHSGGYRVKYPKLDGTCSDLHSNVANVMSEASDVFKAFADSAADGRITPKELDMIRKEVIEFVQAFESSIKIAESGKWDR